MVTKIKVKKIVPKLNSVPNDSWALLIGEEQPSAIYHNGVWMFNFNPMCELFSTE